MLLSWWDHFDKEGANQTAKTSTVNLYQEKLSKLKTFYHVIESIIIRLSQGPGNIVNHAGKKT
jgi:hypothetical protein